MRELADILAHGLLTSPLDHLHTLDDDDFVKVVSADVKKMLQVEYLTALKSPGLNERLVCSLEQLISEVESKVAQRAADVLDDVLSEPEYQRWFAKTLYFKTSVEKRLALAKRAGAVVKIAPMGKYLELKFIAKKVVEAWDGDDDAGCELEDRIDELAELINEIEGVSHGQESTGSNSSL